MSADEPSSSAPPAPQVYCATLPYSGVRKLPLEEVFQLKERRAHASRRVGVIITVAIVAALVCFIGGIFLIGFAMESLPDSSTEAVAVISIIVGVVGLGGGMLYVNDKLKVHQQEVRALDVQLKDPLVRQFSGIFSKDVWSHLADEPALATLLKLGLLDFNDRNPHVLELFLKQDFVYRVDDRHPPRSVPLPIQVIAPRPENAPAFAIPNSWIAPGAEPPQIERRRLSADELDELKNFIRAGNRSLLIAVISFMVAPTYLGGRIGMRSGAAWVGVVCGLAVGAGLLYWRCRHLYRLLRALRADVEEHWVLIGTPDSYRQYDTTKRPDEQNYIEYLACSKVQWTLNGIPAAWRGNTR